MKKIIFLVFFTYFGFSQSNHFTVKKMLPSLEENNFPEVFNSKNGKLADKINTFLQIKHLEHLPKKFTKNPFEKVASDPQNCCSYTEFYDWKVNKTNASILSLSISGETNGAYPEGFDDYENFDTKTGNPILLKELFTESGFKSIDKQFVAKIKNEIRGYLKTIPAMIKKSKRKSAERETLEEQQLMYTDCLSYIKAGEITGYTNFYFENQTLFLIRERCSNHAMRGIDELDKYEISFNYSKIKPFLSSYGNSLFLNSNKNLVSKTPEGKLFKGFIDKKYPITVLVNQFNDGGGVDFLYWYDKTKELILCSGNLVDDTFELYETDKDENPTVKVNVKFIENKKIIGTWTDSKTNNPLSFEVELY